VGADIVLAVDRSASMEGANMAAARAAARSFVELLDVRYHRVALVSFAGDAALNVPLTDNVAATIDGLATLAPQGETNLVAALSASAEHLDAVGRSDALGVIVLLTDGRHNVGTGDPSAVAAEARSRGIQIYTIGLGAQSDSALLKSMAGRDDHYFAAPAPTELFPIYSQILRVVMDSLAGNLIVDDVLGAGMEVVAGSVRPDGLEARNRVRWGRSILPSSGITLTFEVRPSLVGRQAVSASSRADYTDGDGVRRTFEFPQPEVDVAAPLVTATPTPRPNFKVWVPLTVTRNSAP
jgi:uncharacterized protein YegL